MRWIEEICNGLVREMQMPHYGRIVAVEMVLEKLGQKHASVNHRFFHVRGEKDLPSQIYEDRQQRGRPIEQV